MTSFTSHSCEYNFYSTLYKFTTQLLGLLLLITMEHMELEKLNLETTECDKQIKKWELELKDVLTQVETPENSDVEGDEVDDLEFEGPRLALFNVEAVPRRETEYSSLYLCPGYRLRAERKVKRMKEELKRNFLSEIIRDPEYVTVLRQIEELYPDDGGRHYINCLVACHDILNPE